MLMRRRRLLGPILPRLLVALLLASAAALLPGAAGDAADEGHVGKAVAAVERADATAAAQAGGEATQGNGTNKENSLADMIDRAVEKEFPDSEGDQGGGGACI
ncbi:K(+) efflux antiporter 6-like [Hordeum vulgare]|nr:K(+) efflux antiporter 6-like [Hordeum vulgare]